jgi:hypothetical protein
MSLYGVIDGAMFVICIGGKVSSSFSLMSVASAALIGENTLNEIGQNGFLWLLMMMKSSLS